MLQAEIARRRRHRHRRRRCRYGRGAVGYVSVVDCVRAIVMGEHAAVDHVVDLSENEIFYVRAKERLS